MLQSSGLPSFLSMFVYTNHTCLLPSNKKIVTGLTTPSSLYAGLPACRLVCLDRVLRSAARLIGGIPKFGHGMSLNTCLMFYAGSLLSSGFHIGLFPWSGAAYLVLLLFTFVSSVVLSIVL